MPKMPQKVAAKNPANPRAKLISSVVNQPRSAKGTPNRFPELPVREAVEPPLCDICVIQVEYCLMAEGVQSGLGGLIQAVQVARETAVRKAPNGVVYAAFGDNNIDDKDLERMVQAVPLPIAAA